MENSVGDILLCDEQLRTTLHCDDKEKLRRKLLLLQREYLRTAQRLQRAERSEAVRRHVRSRITQHNHQDQGDPEVTSDPCVNPLSVTLNAANGTASGVPESQRHAGAPTDSRRSPLIKFLLPSDAACPETTDPSHDVARGHRRSPALRLRSRRSRLRWEKRSAEAGRSTDNGEEGWEQSERNETAGTQGSEERVENERTEVANESEELFSGADSESPSLLLTHWNTCWQNNTGDMEGKEIEEGQEEMGKETELRSEGRKESESTSLVVACRNLEGRGQDKTQNRKGEEGADSRVEDTVCHKDAEQNPAAKVEREKSHENTVEIKQEKSEGEHEIKGGGLLDSCTLVEGLLFPAEYYVRTTRRMTSSQSQPDMHAVILSQLSVGRHRRSRGRGRVPSRRTGQDVSSAATASPSVGPPMESQAAGTSAEPNSLDSSEISDQVSAREISTDAVTTARPARGRRRRRGRGRGRPQTPRCSFHVDTLQLDSGQTSDSPQPASSPVSSSSPSLRGSDWITPGAPVPDDPQSAPKHSAATQPVSGDRVYPIFLKNSGRMNRSTQMSTSLANWRSLLLPSSSPPAQTSPLPPPSPSLRPLLNNLLNFDIPLDFHLPDDQFASLKLHKLRQVAVESGVEHFTPPSYSTRRSIRRHESCRSSSDLVTPPPLPLSLTPTISTSPNPIDPKQAAPQSVDPQNQSVEHKLTGKLACQSITENLHPECRTRTTSTEAVPLDQDGAAHCVYHHEEKDAVILTSPSQSSISASNTHTSGDRSIKPQPRIDLADRPAGKEPPEELSNKCTAVLACNDRDVPGESPVQRLDTKSPPKEPKESSEPATSPPREGKNQGKSLPVHSIHSQLLLSPSLPPAPSTTPHLRSSALASSPALPSLGLTPHPVAPAFPLTSSPSAPTLILPPPPSPSTLALSPPVLSPCPSLTSLPHSQPPADQVRASPERVAPATCPIQSRGPGVRVALGTEETAEEHVMRCTHTLKSPAGGCLVDACCLRGSSGSLCVAAAGKWAVCLWSQTSASDWRLTHTWSFSEPVINVFPVPDAAGLVCVTLGQLEIREVRMLSCSSLLQVPLCEGLVQVVVGVSKSRVVTSFHSTSGSTLQVFTLSGGGSTLSSRLLASPGVCVGGLAPVDGLPDALVGTDEGGCLFVWNLKSGQLLRRIVLGDGFSHTACLRGYSYCGVLFVLLQHQLLSSLEEEERETTEKDEAEEEEERKKAALLSLVAVNPLSGKSVLAAGLRPPKAWSGRLCEADVKRCSVVGLSQSGCVCVWELGRRGTSRMVWAPESEGWQLARWGGGGTLVTGHHNGDVTLHGSPASLCHNA